MMKKRAMAMLLSAALLTTTGGVLATAANTQTTQPTATTPAVPAIPLTPATPVSSSAPTTPDTVNVLSEELAPLPSTPLGETAEILDFTLRSGLYSYMTVKTDTYDELILNFSDQTCLMDTQTGYPVGEEELKKGDKVFVYYDNMMMQSEPPQSVAQAVLTNLDEQHSPAHLLTVESLVRSEDGTVRVLASDGNVALTLSPDVAISPFQTRNIVTLEDIHIGTRLFAWYDRITYSRPGQAIADRVVVLSQNDAALSIAVEDDMAIPQPGRVQDGVAVVPVRPVAEALGYTVTWNGANQSVQLTKDKTTATLKLNDDAYTYTAIVEGLSKTNTASAYQLGTIMFKEKGQCWVSAELFSLLGESVQIYNGCLLFNSSQLPSPQDIFAE